MPIPSTPPFHALMIILDDFVASLEPELAAGGRYRLSRPLFDRLVALYEEAAELVDLMDDKPDQVVREADVDRLLDTLDVLERDTPQ
jgi:hypothetical protein